MGRRTFAPQTKQFNERMITRNQDNFNSGAWDDVPASSVPQNGTKWHKNAIAYQDRIEPRGGSLQWPFTAVTGILPSVRTGYTWTKTDSTVTKTGGASFDTDYDVGRFIVHDDGVHELITAVNSITEVTVSSSDAHAASTAGWIRGGNYGGEFHKSKNKLVIQLDNRFYYSAISSISWAEVCLAGTTRPTATLSTFKELGDWFIVYNANGIFKIDLSVSVPVYYKINTAIPTTLITSNSKTALKPYCRRYTYALSRLSGSTYNRDRTDGTTVIEQTTGTCATDVTVSRDYGSVWMERPTGDAATTYGVLTGGALIAPYNAVAGAGGWQSIVDASFVITVDGTTDVNIGPINFSTALTMADVAELLQTGIQEYFPNVTVTYGANKFIFTNPIEGGTITVTKIKSLGVGTDIGAAALSCQTGAGGGTVTSPTYTGKANIATLTLPANSDHYTHYSLFATLDTGENGTDPITGQNNSPEVFIWHSDIPIAKAGTIQYTAASRTVVSAANMFTPEDVGTTLMVGIAAGTNVSGTIESYADAKTVVIVAPGLAGLGAATDYPACIGGGSAFLASQDSSTGIIIATKYSVAGGFTSADIGKTIFWSSGETAVITGYTSATTVTATISASAHAAEGFTISPVSRSFTDIIRDDASDTMAIVKSLRPRQAGFTLQNRFHTPFSNSNAGAVCGLFVFSMNRNATRISYCVLPLNKPYFVGFYDESIQYDTLKDGVSALVEFTDELIVICGNSTYSIPTNGFGTDNSREGAGIITAVITNKRTVDESIGCKNYGSIAKLGRNIVGLQTSDGAWRTLSGSTTNSAGGYSENLAYNKAQKKLAAINNTSVAIYHPVIGYNIWSNAAYGASAITDISYRFGTRAEEGIGWSENTGTKWIWPENKSSIMTIIDSKNFTHVIILDAITGKFYDITTRDGPTGSLMVKYWNDKVISGITVGTIIASEIAFGEDRGTFEHFYLNHKESHFYMRPYDETYKSETVAGITYDSSGYPGSFAVDASLYCDGSETATATANSMNLNGDIVCDKDVEARRMQAIVTIGAAPWKFVGRQHYYVAKDRPSNAANNVNTEMDNQSAFAEPTLWADIFLNKVINRVDGSTIIAAPSIVTGPDGNSSAFTMVAGTTYSFGSVTMSMVAGTLLLWLDTNDPTNVASLVTTKIGATAANLVLVSVTAVGGFYLYYLNSAVATGALTMLPAQNRKCCDIRFFSAILTAANKTYYYNDVSNNSGNIIMVR